MTDTDVVTYCGLCCLDCPGFKGRIPNLARDLRKELRATKYEKFADFASKEPFGKALKNYKECYETLGFMAKFRCMKGCRNGGGPPFCKIRSCCNKKEFVGCWQCEEFESCEKLNFLKGVHDEAHLKNLRIIKKKGLEDFIKGKRNW